MQKGDKPAKTEKGRKKFSIVRFFIYFFGVLFALVTLAPVFEHFNLHFLSQSIYTVGGFLCHQMYTRSMHLFDLQAAVCARDQFMYLALALSAFFTSKYNLRRIEWWLAIILLIPAGLDGGLQFFSSLGLTGDFFYQSTVLLRAVTGSLMGTGLGFILFPMLKEAEEELHEPLR